MQLGVRLYAGSGPLVRDHLQSSMLGAMLEAIDPVWRPTLEVAVQRPIRGVIDLVLEGPEPPLIACEAHSDLRRLEQQVRWSRAKAEALADARGTSVSRLLLLRSTTRTRALAAEFGPFLQTAYPGRHVDAVASLRSAVPWPGDAIIWCRVEGGVATVMERPPRGIRIGR
jgi:hypothetical protein